MILFFIWMKLYWFERLLDIFLSKSIKCTNKFYILIFFPSSFPSRLGPDYPSGSGLHPKRTSPRPRRWILRPFPARLLCKISQPRRRHQDLPCGGRLPRAAAPRGPTPQRRARFSARFNRLARRWIIRWRRTVLLGNFLSFFSEWNKSGFERQVGFYWTVCVCVFLNLLLTFALVSS